MHSPGNNPWVRRVALALGLIVALPLALWVYGWVAERPVSKLRVGGFAAPASGPLEPFLTQRAKLWQQESVRLETGFHLWHPTRAELGASLPVEDALRDAARLTRSLNPIVALGGFWRGNLGRGHDVRWRARITDEAALDRYTQRIREAVDRLPVPGSYDPNGQPIDGLPGEALDVEAMKRAIRGAIARGATSLKVSTLVTPAPHSFRRFDEPTRAADVLMMAQETEYRPGNAGRAVNIELAARALDGKLIMPGAAFSFNATVGKRDAVRGFQPAAELMNGEVVQGIGGGVCQVAGTLHAAAFFAGLVVEEYRPHSRLNQFAYLRPGLDTMVAWPDHVTELAQTKDMRLRNPYPFPVLIKASAVRKAPFQAVLRVELYGASRPFRVDFRFEEVDRVPAGELTRVDPAMAPGERRVEQQPLDGIVIMRHRTIYMPTGRHEEDVRVAYPPTPRIVAVGAG